MTADPETVTAIVRAALAIMGILGSLAVGLMILMARRFYRSIDVLFTEIGTLNDQVTVLKMALLRINPDATGMFEALTGGRK